MLAELRFCFDFEQDEREHRSWEVPDSDSVQFALTCVALRQLDESATDLFGEHVPIQSRGGIAPQR